MERAHAERLLGILFYIIVLAFWQIAADLELAPSYLLPSPTEVAQRLYELYQDGMLISGVKSTFLRMIVGFIFGSLLGLTIGILMSVHSVLSRTFRSLLLGVQTLPTAAWVPLAILIFGLKDSGIWFVIIMSCFPAVGIATCDAIDRVPQIWLKVGKTYELSTARTVKEILIPASLPSIITGLRLGWTLGWHGAVSAELIKSTVGLGFLLHMGREMHDMAQVIGIMMLTILFGLLIDKLIFVALEKRLARRWGLLKAESHL